MSMRTYPLIVLSGLLALSGPLHADPHSVRNTRDVTGPITVNLADQSWVTHVLPTGRIVSPVGHVNGSPNFVTAIVPFGRDVVVLANGATRAETLSFYARSTLIRKGRIAAYQSALVARTNVGGKALNHPDLRVGHQSFFQGLALGPDRTLYVAGGNSNDVIAFKIRGGRQILVRRYPLVWQQFPGNQYPYHYQGHHLGRPRLFYPDALTLGRRSRHLYVTGLLANSLARINLRTGRTRYLNVGPYPFAVCLADHGRRLAVSLWGGSGVAIVDRRTLRLIGTVGIGPRTVAGQTRAGVHPTALVTVPGTANVFVALANVDRIAELDTATLKVQRLIQDRPYPDAPPGSYPDGLTLTDDRLFVANAGNDDVAVYDLATGRRLGLIPTGWYPTAITHTRHALYVVSAKGLGSGSNIEHQWVGNMMAGLVQRIGLGALQRHLKAWTRQSLTQDGFARAQRQARHTMDAKTKAFLKRHIRYVVFILRENKTFDEDLGDDRAAGAWADPALDLYGPRELPNLYRLAGQYTLLVNFMADGEVTAQGHQWTTAASDSDFVQRTWPEYYSGRGLVANPGWSQSLIPGGASGTGGMPQGADNPYAIYENLSALGKWSNPWISYPGRLFLFNDLLRHHVSFEDFGEFVSRSEAGNISPAMHRHLATSFPGWDRMILDTYRVRKAVAWLRAHPGARFPHFIYIWLPDDHTAGRSPCYYSPDYYVANNDFATAEFIHYLSTTPAWRHMVVFLTEDDAQSGADHINAHRTFALAISPWVKRGLLETRLYSQVNIVKTAEAALGLPPLSQWDQNASVISGIWTDHPDFTPPRVERMRVPVTFNAGHCTDYTLLRREAGVVGHVLTPEWYRNHQARHGRNLPAPAGNTAYSPTTLLKVSGPEQMRQEWIAAKGRKAYARVMRYIQAYARSHQAPQAAFLAGGTK